MFGIKAATLWTDFYCIAADGTALISIFVYDPLMRFALWLIAAFASQIVLFSISPAPIHVTKDVFLITSPPANLALTALPFVLLIPHLVTDSASAAIPHMIGILCDTTSFALAVIPLMSDDPAHDILLHMIISISEFDRDWMLLI